MRTQQLVRTTATVVRIVELEPGNVYKRLIKKSYVTEGTSPYEIKLGVVQSVLDNGEQTAITALEFEHSYATIKPEIRVFGEDSNLQIFDATPAEVETYYAELRDSADQAVKSAINALEAARRIQDAVKDATRAALSAPKTTLALSAEEANPDGDDLS